MHGAGVLCAGFARLKLTDMLGAVDQSTQLGGDPTDVVRHAREMAEQALFIAAGSPPENPYGPAVELAAAIDPKRLPGLTAVLGRALMAMRRSPDPIADLITHLIEVWQGWNPR